MKNFATTQALMKVLADSYALYLKTQNYHWNVTGPNFRSLHLLFEDQYTDLAQAIDEIAERIVTLGQKVDGSFSAFSKLTSIQDGNMKAPAETMLKELAEDHEKIIESWRKVFATAQSAQDEATLDMVAQRLRVHEKNRWILESSL